VFLLLRASTFQVEMDQDTRRSLRARPLDPQSEPVPEDAYTVRYQCLVLREGTDPAMGDPDDAAGRASWWPRPPRVWALGLGEEDRFARPARFVGKGRVLGVDPDPAREDRGVRCQHCFPFVVTGEAHSVE